MSDLIDRQAAIEALKNDMASLDHIIKGMSAYDVRLDAYVSQRNQVNYDIYTINNLPPAQLGTNLAEVGTDCISRAKAIDEIKEIYEWHDNVTKERIIEHFKQLPPAQSETAKRIVGKSKDGMTLWYQCDMCNEPVDAQDNFCRECGRRLIDE